MAPVRVWLIALFVTLSVLPCAAVTRHYYIAAEDVTWDYAPSGRDLLYGRPIPMIWGQHTKWPKTRYFEYTDATFTVRKAQPEWLGILGPMIRAEVGDEIVVDFLNRGQAAHGIHPHGVRYDKASEGAFYLPWGAGARVGTGGRFTYHWFADEGSGPGPGQLSSVVWWYHPHVDEPRETNAGLMGPIIITAKGKAKPDGSPKDVDQEFVTSFMIFDQLGGRNEGQFHAINGYIFGNLPGLVVKKGARVRWYVMGMGNEKDLHTPHWHGKTVTDGRRHIDVVELLPASTIAVDMLADNVGTWIFHCQVADHMEAGMMAEFTIYEPSTKPCPLQFVRGDFWDISDEKYKLTVKNISGKKIKSYGLTFEHFAAPYFLQHPYKDSWVSQEFLAPGGEQTLEMKAYANGGKDLLGWVLLPSRINFEDGSVWSPQERGECFAVFWRDKDHPDLKVLPPEQFETNPD
jgi:FtsP/CotA-like multicopper oxidase with cupredoxin domain